MAYCKYLLDTLADFGHRIRVRVGTLQKPTVSPQHLRPLVARQLDEAIARVHDRVVGHLRVRYAEARLAGL